MSNKCSYCQSKKVEIKLKVANESNLYLIPELSGVERCWLICTSCGVYFSTPDLNSAQISRMYEIYRNEEFRGETPDEYFDRITSINEKNSENFHRVTFMKSFIDTQPDKVLDIGSGGGVLIHQMQQSWPKTRFWGVEPSSSYCELTSRRTGAIIKNSLYGMETFPNQSFDLITCCQVFEHIKELKEFIRAIYSNMHANTIFYLEVPDIIDFDHLESNHSRFTEPSHLWYFSQKFLQNFFEQESFQVITSKKDRTVRGRNNLTLILKIK